MAERSGAGNTGDPTHSVCQVLVEQSQASGITSDNDYRAGGEVERKKGGGEMTKSN